MRLALAAHSGWPIPACMSLAVLATLMALLVRDSLPPFPYALFALSMGGLFLTLPLLSDLGALLRHDEGEDWLGALPARGSERTLARVLHLLVLLALLVLAWFAPWAALAREALGWGGRITLPLLGLALALGLAAALIWIQQLLLERLQSALLLLEIGLLFLVVTGMAQLLGRIPEIAILEPAHPSLAWLPPAWLARTLVDGPWWPALGSTVVSIAALLSVPSGATSGAKRVRVPGRWLRPLRRMAQRHWVRPAEQGAFDLVFWGLPREREVALRTYPILGIPLAFLWISAWGESGKSATWRADLLALLLFTPSVYLPLLLTHVPLSESAPASWILRLAPRSDAAHVGGAIKALFARWLLPLHLALLGLGVALGEAELLLRLWLPALLLSMVLLRVLYARCVRDLPLSTPPEELRSDVDWAGLALPLAVGLSLLAVLSNRYVGRLGGLGLAVLLVLVEMGLERKQSRAEG
jgi:hypothetical protein